MPDHVVQAIALRSWPCARGLKRSFGKLNRQDASPASMSSPRPAVRDGMEQVPCGPGDKTSGPEGKPYELCTARDAKPQGKASVPVRPPSADKLELHERRSLATAERRYGNFRNAPSSLHSSEFDVHSAAGGPRVLMICAERGCATRRNRNGAESVRARGSQQSGRTHGR